jgi:hypothetical protein
MTSVPIRDSLADDLITPQDTSHRGSSTRSAAPKQRLPQRVFWGQVLGTGSRCSGSAQSKLRRFDAAGSNRAISRGSKMQTATPRAHCRGAKSPW